MAVERQQRRLTEKHRSNISSGTRKVLSTPQMSERLSQIQQRIWDESPQRKQEQSLTQTLLWQDPNHRRKMIESRTGIRLSKKHRKNISAALSGRVSPLRGRTMSDEHREKISLAKRKRDELKKQEKQNQPPFPPSEEEIIEENVDLNLWKSAIEENLIGPILNQNLLTKEEIDKIKRDLEAGIEPPETLMDKFSIAVARTA